MNEQDIVTMDKPQERTIAAAANRHPTQLVPIYQARWQATRADDEEGLISPRFVLHALTKWWYVALLSDR